MEYAGGGDGQCLKHHIIETTGMMHYGRLFYIK